MLVASNPGVKKRKKTSSPLSVKAPKKKKKRAGIAKNPVPELILCADQLKSDLDKKEEEKYDPYYEPVLHPKIEPIKLEEISTKPENSKVKKKKRKRNTDIKLDRLVKSEENFVLHPTILNSADISGTDSVIKAEPTTPEKFQVKIEPTEFTSLFNSNIKQELENTDDAVDKHVCKKLSFKLSDSCIVKYSTTLHCAIPPFFVNNIRNGIKSHLKNLQFKYLESEQGILLRYTNIRLMEQAARIVSISPELHFDISCTVTMFKPEVGAQLEGTVVKIGPGYVNCLVYGYFTAVVYDHFTNPVDVGSVIRFKLQFYQVTVHNDFILKGSPVR